MANRNRRKDRAYARSKIIELLGNKCLKCSQNDANYLHIDHKNGTEGGIPVSILKTTMSRGWLYDPQRIYSLIQREIISINDFQLLCVKCHIIKTYNNKDYLGAKSLQTSRIYSPQLSLFHIPLK